MAGTQIGDVGIFTPDGGFDSLFNICRGVDDPRNCYGVPESFEQIELGPGDIRLQGQRHSRGSHVSNAKITKRRVDVNVGVDANVYALGCVFCVSRSYISGFFRWE